jgi:glycosyltransferase involved in cell wall biosynthesis
MHAKAVIVPSQWYETFGMIITEAYAAHRPVIAGNIGNIAALVEEGMTGLRFEYNSADALKNTILQIQNIDIDAMGENAYRKYKAEFMPEKNYSVLKRVYDSVVKE